MYNVQVLSPWSNNKVQMTHLKTRRHHGKRVLSTYPITSSLLPVAFALSISFQHLIDFFIGGL